LSLRPINFSEKCETALRVENAFKKVSRSSKIGYWGLM
jgi:predicted GIY-YIG superfamily endonuclease